jgi:glycosyltransferase involved in cell wall biosynthesis
VPKVSVTVITRNEATNLARALESVAWADEIVVVDCGSTDGTVDVARRYTERIIVRDWPGYGAQKNHAATLAAHDWILSIDADERVTPGLAAEVRTLLEAGPSFNGYRIPRVTWYLGRWIRSTDWYPDYQLRLYDRRAGAWIERHVHESVRVDGRAGTLAHEIEHYAYRGLAQHVETMARYSALAARQMHEEGRRATLVGLALHPPLAFLRNYILRGGIRDGLPGLIVSGLNSSYVFLKLAKLWEFEHAGTAPDRARPNSPRQVSSESRDGASREDRQDSDEPRPRAEGTGSEDENPEPRIQARDPWDRTIR